MCCQALTRLRILPAGSYDQNYLTNSDDAGPAAVHTFLVLYMRCTA